MKCHVLQNHCQMLILDHHTLKALNLTYPGQHPLYYALFVVKPDKLIQEESLKHCYQRTQLKYLSKRYNGNWWRWSLFETLWRRCSIWIMLLWHNLFFLIPLTPSVKTLLNEVRVIALQGSNALNFDDSSTMVDTEYMRLTRVTNLSFTVSWASF